MANVDVAYERATEIVADVLPRIAEIETEEDAKIQLVTRFLTEVLGWRFADISTEKKHDNGYSDYHLSHAGSPAIVVEAKRQGVIDVRTSNKRRRPYKISGPVLKNAIVGIDQAASYAAPEGIQLAILTDGVKWIVFKPFIPGIPFKSKEAILYPNLESVLDDFSEFFELLSKHGFDQNLYKRVFDELHDSRTHLTQSLISAFQEIDIKPQPKSALAIDLEAVFDRYFASLIGDDDQEMIIDCFVETRESRLADFALQKLVTNVLGNVAPVSDSVGDDLSDLIQSTIDSDTGETIFIVGQPGAGKTTFLDRFFKRTLPQDVAAQCCIVNINSLDASSDEDVSPAWYTEQVISSLEQQIYEEGCPNWNDLLGLYHLEYKRRSRGVDSILYESDRNAFRLKFSKYMEKQVENDREGYARRLLTDLVSNRKLLPIFVIDNTDEFGINHKVSIFQHFQSFRRHAGHCLLFFPVTDRSAWSFSKTEIFNIYSSKSYFLPTPSPREIFRKRVSFIRKQNSDDGERNRGQYLVGRSSWKLSIGDLDRFTTAIEKIFVEDDFASHLIASVANYNIRQTLLLCRRIVTSSSIKIEELMKSFLAGKVALPGASEITRALLIGDHSFYRKDDKHLVFPIFDVDSRLRHSPLLHLRILVLLQSRREASADVEGAYLDVNSINRYFDVIGYAEAAIEHSLAKLFESGLIEAFDASRTSAASAQKVAITYSGLKHVELSLFNSTFFGELALTATMIDTETARQLRDAFDEGGSRDEALTKVNRLFSLYLLTEDQKFGRIPDSEQFKRQAALLVDLGRYGSSETSTIYGRSSNRSGIAATVDFFDQKKGFGFVILDNEERAFIHATVVKNSGLDSVSDGDHIVCNVSMGTRGLAVDSIVQQVNDKSLAGKVYQAVIYRLFDDRDYGFAHVPMLGMDAFFHLSVFPDSMNEVLVLGSKVDVELNRDKRGRGIQIRRVIGPAVV